jgi:hypothetical protein
LTDDDGIELDMEIKKITDKEEAKQTDEDEAGRRSMKPYRMRN